VFPSRPGLSQISEPLGIGGIPRDPGQQNAKLDNRTRNQKTGRETEAERDQWQRGTVWPPLSPDAGARQDSWTDRAVTKVT